jgi:hypothetical protein
MENRRKLFRSLTYNLKQCGKTWQCYVTTDWIGNNLDSICGSGSRPELAIRDWKEQYRRKFAQ